MKNLIQYSIFHIQHSASSATGKIILSGEYAVVFGKSGIAVPSKERMNLTLSPSQKNDALTIEWTQSDISDSWKSYSLKIIELIREKAGSDQRAAGSFPSGIITINSDVPLGKGMGSSTALVIALIRLLAGPDCEDLARSIEDQMNPGNSGLDFAVIWNEQPVLFKKGTQNAPVPIDLGFLNDAELIDTGKPNESTPELVGWVKSRMNESAITGAIETIGACTERFLTGESPFSIIHDHHRAQIALGVVPEATQKIIADIEKKGGAAKVLGAGARTGGGGMVLVLR